MIIYVIRHGETDGNHRGVLQGQMDLPLNEMGRNLATVTGKALADIPFDVVISSPLSRARETAELILAENHFWTEQEADSSLWRWNYEQHCFSAGDGSVQKSPAISGNESEAEKHGAGNSETDHSETEHPAAGNPGIDNQGTGIPRTGYLDSRIQEISFGQWEGKGIRPDNWELPESFRDFYRRPFSFAGGPGGESIRALCERTGAFYRELIARPELMDKTILVSTHGCAMRALLHQVYEDKTKYWHGKVPDNCAVNIIEVNERQESRLTGDDLIFYEKSLCVNLFRDTQMG